MRQTFSFKLFLLVCALFAVAQLVAQDSTSTTLRDQLQQLTAQLQLSPSDQGLREKIIALALTLNPRPATPDAATMAEGAAEYAFKNAKGNSDYSKAAKQYEKALLLAPWLAADYFNCGVAHEKAGENKEAIRSFNLYLLAAPNADDAFAVKKRIGGLQYATQEAEEQNSAAADAAKAEQAARLQAEAVYQGLDGGVWTFKQVIAGLIRIHTRSTLEVHGHEIEAYHADDLNARTMEWHTTFTSRQFQVDNQRVTISDDGQSIAVDLVYGSGTKYRFVYQRNN
jgi:tetratricopeptide (TPR) repeat protein